MDSLVFCGFALTSGFQYPSGSGSGSGSSIAVGAALISFDMKQMQNKS